jgi:hypothetical protein
MVNPISAAVSFVDGVSDDDQNVIRELFEVWRRKYPRNVLRSAYFDAHQEFKDFGIAIPPKIRSRTRAVVGWPAKAVRALSDLSVWEGFSFSGQDSLGLESIARENRLDVIIPQVVQSAYKHSCAFITVTGGGVGEPAVKFTPRAADWSAALWDHRAHRVRAALTITDVNKDRDVIAFDVFLSDKVISCERSGGAWRAVNIQEHSLGRVPVVALPADPQLDRPFGRSRITRPLMGLTDIGWRTIVRMESNAEFYSAPRVWFLGLDPDVIGDDKWTSLISVINSVSKDEDGEKPTLQQVSQASMQPQSDMLKTIALMVASETDLPVNDLGITMDNPASAEAMAAAERKLSRIADRQNIIFGDAIEELMRVAALALDPAATSDVLSSFRCEWAATREDSNAARADAFAKIASVVPTWATSEVGLRHLGLTGEEVTSVLSDARRQQSQGVLSQLLAGGGTAEPNGEAVSDAADLKAKFDALGVAVRAGVDPDDAARRLGLGGVKFTGAVPVSLRLPETDATALEEK